MTRLLIHVEGETEESFVNEVLTPHLYESGFTNVSARLIGNARMREKRGGIRAWQAVKKDIVRHLKEDPKAAAATFVDFYALPATGDGAWPGRQISSHAPFDGRASIVEQALSGDVTQALGVGFLEGRFIPYVVMHEFEGLLFSDPHRLAQGIGRSELAADLQSIRDQFETPEQINDSPLTAPSKRIIALVPGYQKPLHGTLAALEIGLARMRAACPQFNAWLGRLERWAAAQN